MEFLSQGNPDAECRSDCMPADKPISEWSETEWRPWQNDEVQLNVASAQTPEHDQESPSRNPDVS
jgi:hypothetical protein